jgi:hypothetical protein
MASIERKSAMLTVHPATSSDAVRSLGVELWSEGPDLLVFQYSLAADMSRICIPKTGPSRQADGLWRHTCFEAFVAGGDARAYHEFNFSPSLDWAIYRFNSYREGMSPAEISRVPTISVHRGEHGLELKSAVHLNDLVDLDDAVALRIALAAVIEEDNGSLSYWGLRHPPGNPDFHHAHGFALDMVRS